MASNNLTNINSSPGLMGTSPLPPSSSSSSSEDSLHARLNEAQLRETSRVSFDQLKFSKQLHKREVKEQEAHHRAELEKVQNTLWWRSGA